MRSLACLLTLTTVAVLATACGQGPGDVEAGDCFESGTVAAFGWGTEVSCEHPHTVEVFAVRDVSDILGEYPRDALGQQGHPARERYLGLLREFCEPAWSRYTGYDTLSDRLSDGLGPDAPAAAREALVLPAIFGDVALEATPASEWDAGNQLVVCYQVFGRPHVGGQQAVPVRVPVLETMSREQTAVPVEVRECARTPRGGEGERRVSCLDPHDREYLGYVSLVDLVGAAPGLDQAFLERFDSTTATDEQWAVIDEVCGRLFAPLLHSERTDISVLAQVITKDKQWGWTDGGRYLAACFARTAQEITHSVVTPPPPTS